MIFRGSVFLFLLALFSAIQFSDANAQLRVSGRNPRYFVLDSDTNTAVFLAGSHTWLNNVNGGVASTINDIPIFNWTGYLAFLSANGHNMVKYWDQETAGQSLLSNSASYRSSHLQCWKRTGPGIAQDGGPQWNLDSLDEAYFARVKDRIDTLAGRGIFAVVMLFNGWCVANDKATGFSGKPFLGHPFNSANNVQGIGLADAAGDNTHRLPGSGGNAEIFQRQIAYVKRLIDVLNSCDNIGWEISNESNSTSQNWQYAIIDTIKNYEGRKPKRHFLNMSVEYPGGTDAELFASAAHNDAASPTTDYSGLVNSSTAKTIITDTDHICGECKDGDWVYKSFLNGVGAIVFMDPWDGKYYPHMASNYDSTASSWVSARKAMGQVAAVARRLNVIDMFPQPSLASTNYCLAGGKKWVVYAPNGGSFVVNLSSTNDVIRGYWVDVTTGSSVAIVPFTGGSANQSFTCPDGSKKLLVAFSENVVGIDREVRTPAIERVELFPCYPNPFNGKSIISFTLTASSQVALTIFNTLGERVAQPVSGKKEAGRYTIGFDSSGLPSGLYLCCLNALGQIQTAKMLLVK